MGVGLIVNGPPVGVLARQGTYLGRVRGGKMDSDSCHSWMAREELPDRLSMGPPRTNLV